MAKLKGISKKAQNTEYTRRKLKTMYFNKFYNLYMNLIDFENLDRQQKEYLKRQFWDKGTVAVFKDKIAEELIFTPYTENSWNIYDFAETVTLVNLRGVSFIPSRVMTVNKDVVIGFAQYNKKPVSEIVNWYIERIVQVDMVINTNLQIHNMPFVVKCDPQDKEKMTDLANRILSGEVVIFTDLEASQMADVLSTGAPYIIDKLHAYKVQLLNEIYTYLGLDNKGDSVKNTTETLDEVNSNNVLINASQDQFITNLKEFADDVKEYLGYEFTPVLKVPQAEETAESRNKADAENEANALRKSEGGVE